MQDTQQLKQELIEKISNINQWDILMVLREDVNFYENGKEQNRLGLSEDDYDELKTLAKEPYEKDTTSLEEFKQQTEQWRTHS